MITGVGTALSVLVLGSPSDGLPQDAFPVPTIQASVPAAETPEALVQGEIVDASGARFADSDCSQGRPRKTSILETLQTRYLNAVRGIDPHPIIELSLIQRS